jgi:hypothetical protein
MVFAQPTERNERISSLLSAVFLRTVRSDYTEAATHAFPSSIERLEYNEYTNSHATDSSEGLTGSPVPVVLFIQHQEEQKSGTIQDRDDTLELLLSIKRAVGRTAVACAELSTTGSYEDNVRSLRGFLKLLQPQTPLFVVESSVTAQWVQEVVLDETITLNMLGMVTLYSRQQKLPHILINIRSHCPRLLLAVPRKGDDNTNNDLCNACRSNPNVIAVSLPNISGLSSTTKPGEPQHCEATCLWAARTVVKFIQAVSVTTAASENSTPRTITSGGMSLTNKDYNVERRLTSNLSWKFRASRL